MVVLLLHGAAGGWDELAIAAIALAVLWVAVKLAGRNPANDDGEDVSPGEVAIAPEEDPTDSARPSPTKLG